MLVVVFTDVSGQRTGPIFKGQAAQKNVTAWPLKMETVCPETSVNN